jgi:hypothetical protein
MFYFYYSTKLPILLHVSGAILLTLPQAGKPSHTNCLSKRHVAPW